ncbi:siderophore-interacting protein [Herbiconiux solani]|uniref:siderophore-interacting protein n=1 Tax=Herbiconiux solani TaxID=661329 RepID=UPI0008252929|nr:siderophore-interacting protein [Herbiconiux solani]
MTSSVQTLVQPFRLFEVRLTGRRPLSDNFVRFTFSGADLDRFADNGYDQRIKLIFPVAGDDFGDGLGTGSGAGADSGCAALMGSQEDWYTVWRDLPDETRPPIRTYTIRAVRPEQGEIDVDIVLHGLVGVASTWASTAPLGSSLIICGPNADHDGVHGGIDFHLPARTGRILVAGDETALPAIANILEKLPADARGCALVEVPDAGDSAALPSHPGIEVIVVGRGARAHGEALVPLVREHAGRLLDDAAAPVTFSSAASAGPVALDDVDVDHDMLWEVPEEDPEAAGTPLYAWLAGEAGVIKLLRRHLVAERGIDRRSVAFMGYWRHGKSEGD